MPAWQFCTPDIHHLGLDVVETTAVFNKGLTFFFLFYVSGIHPLVLLLSWPKNEETQPTN